MDLSLGSEFIYWTNTRGVKFVYSVEGCKPGYAQVCRNNYCVTVSTAHLWRWNHGESLLQDALPHMSATDREFLLTGMTPDQQKELYG